METEKVAVTCDYRVKVSVGLFFDPHPPGVSGSGWADQCAMCCNDPEVHPEGGTYRAFAVAQPGGPAAWLCTDCWHLRSRDVFVNGGRGATGRLLGIPLV
jgi:hypothetical protein